MNLIKHSANMNLNVTREFWDAIKKTRNKKENFYSNESS